MACRTLVLNLHAFLVEWSYRARVISPSPFMLSMSLRGAVSSGTSLSVKGLAMRTTHPGAETIKLVKGTLVVVN